MSAVKTGWKILRGIKKMFEEFEQDRPRVHHLGLNEIIMMRTILFTFKSIYDLFIYAVREKFPAAVELPKHATDFNQQTDAILEELKYPKNEKFNEYLATASKQVTEKLESIESAYRGRNPNQLQFQEYYFDQPVLHMFDIYI